MLETHRELDKRYRELRESRSGPIFFVEHGLREGEVADVVADVSNHLVTHPLESVWWNFNCLPLLVATTEVGYRYRGSGTDFWPVLEAEFGAKISTTDRQRIRDLFSNASEIYRGARPPATPWAKAFHLIAWPITHALVPLEFHRPLALTLANLRVNVGELSDDDLHRAIRIAASSSSARFSTLIEDAVVVVAVTRAVLGDNSAELCAETVERIAADLASDQATRRAVAVARRIQRTVAERTAPPASLGALLPSVMGSLHLRRRNSVMTLEAVFPPIQTDLQMGLRRALRHRRYAVRLWGVSTPVPSEQLLSCLPFTVKLTTVPPEDAELLPGLDQVDIDAKLRDLLAAFKLDVAPPLLFVVSSDEALGRRVRGPSISGNRKYWLLSGLGEGPRGCAALGQVGPYDCHLLDPAEETARELLRDLGFQLRFGVSVGFAGRPPLERDAPVPAFAVGDQRIVVPRRAPPEGLSVRLGDEQVHLTGDDVATVLVERGDHTLRVSSSNEDRDYVYRGMPSPRSVPPVTCSIAPRSSDLTVQALLRGALDFAVESFAALEGLKLTVEIEVSSRRFFATAPLGSLPCSVSSEQEPFKTLLDDEIRGLLAQAQSPTLRLSVGRLCSRDMVLEQRVRPCWWQRGRTTKLRSRARSGRSPSVGSLRRLQRPGQRRGPTTRSKRRACSRRWTLTSRSTATRPSSPRSASRPLGRGSKPLPSRSRASRDAVAPDTARSASKTWSRVTSGGLSLRALRSSPRCRRRQVTEVLDGWLTEISCGEEWVRREATLGDVDPWEGLVRVCDETGLGRDSYIELSREDEFKVTRIAVREIRLELPDLWVRVGPPCDLTPEDYEALDLACGRAYTELAGVYREQGKEEIAAGIEEGDPGAVSDDWNSVLGRVKSTAELQPLAEMLLPSDIARGLMTLEPTMITLDELTEELTAWARDARRALAGSVPPADTLKAILALWIEPEAAASLDWRGALDVLLVERPVARAARYLALRSRSAARRGSTR